MSDDLHEKMLASLRALVEDTADWGVMILMHYQGDVPFLTPIVPKLRGWEIVANPHGTYDLWKNDKPKRMNLSKPQVQAWFAKHTPPDQKLEEHVVRWTEQTLKHYGVAKVA